MKFHLLLLLLCVGVSTYPLLSAPAPIPAPRADDEKALEGTWSAVSYAEDAADDLLPSADALQTMRLILVRNEKRILEREHFSREEYREGKVTFVSHFSAFRVDRTKEPKAIDFILTDPYTGEDTINYPGIYELKGDTLRICRTLKANGPRPDKFEAGKGSARVLAVWKRKPGRRPGR